MLRCALTATTLQVTIFCIPTAPDFSFWDCAPQVSDSRGQATGGGPHTLRTRKGELGLKDGQMEPEPPLTGNPGKPRVPGWP